MGPDSHESSEDSDAIATDSDAGSETDSVSQLVSEATIADNTNNVEKGEVAVEESNLITDSLGPEEVDQIKEKSDCEQTRKDKDVVGDVVNESGVEISKDTAEKCVHDENINKQGKTESVDDTDNIGGQENMDEREIGQAVDEKRTHKSDQKENSEHERTDETKVLNGAASMSLENNDTECDSNECRKIV